MRSTLSGSLFTLATSPSSCHRRFALFLLSMLTLNSPLLLLNLFSSFSKLPSHLRLAAFGLVAVTYHCDFIQSLLTAKNTQRWRWRDGQQCLRCTCTAPAECLNRAGNKGQKPAGFNSFASNKTVKKSQRSHSWAVGRW